MADGTPRKAAVEMGLTYNLGNYESIRVSVTVEDTYTGEPGKTRDEVVAALQDDVRNKLYSALADEIKNFREVRPDLEG